MPKRRELVKSGAPVTRIKENSRLMRTHESMVDFIKAMNDPLFDSRRGDPLMNVLTSGLFGLDFSNYGLEDDIIYSDDDDDDDGGVCGRKPIEPHPRIRQLTDEEADRHARELMAEEERRKEKTQKNKRKKMRKKEKKRLEKENALKENLPEEDKSKSDSDNQEEDAIIENNAEANEPAECAKSQNSIEAAGCDESGGSNKEETKIMEVNKEDEEQKGVNLNNSDASATKSVPKEPCNQKPAKERKKEKNKLQDVKLLEEKKPKVKEKTELKKKKEEKRELIKEKTIDPVVEEYARRSRELAGAGNRLAASGQYEMAVKCFTDAIKFNPKEFRLFGNRSLCYERLQQYENALRDADVALSMEPNWIKGLFRKGKALCGLKRYYEASLIYREVLKLESSSMEATQELKRAQTLHLMEMGFTWAQSTEALKTHATLEEAVEALFSGDSSRSRGDAAAAATSSWNNTEQPVVQGQDDDVGDDDDDQWTVLTTSRHRTQQIKESSAQGQGRSHSHSPTPHSRNAVKPDLFSIWVGSLAPAVTYATLHELFSRVGAVYSIKMLLEQQCAFVNYTRREDCDRAIQCFNGMVLEGAPLYVRYPSKGPGGFGPFKKECFFWRTTGCTRDDCTYKHVPEHKNIDKDKFTSRLGFNNV